MLSRTVRAFALGASVLLATAPANAQEAAAPARGPTIHLSQATLRDKIRGGWAGQTIGVTFGGPYEFRFNGTMIQDYVPLRWRGAALRESYRDNPGLYDDLYMDLTFVDVLEREGLDAPASSFARAYAGAGYMLWHANQMARYNILHGISPPQSGAWRNNPEADDIDFQIESDFIGLMHPGMPNSAARLADRVGHVMNAGDGWYGGVFVSAMYTLAFTESDPERIVTEALKTIPAASTFHRTIADVVRWHRQYPADWRRAWFELQRTWAEDIGCPDGVFQAFDIDAKINAAYVALALLYGGGDFGRSVDIAARSGQDADCNASTVAGILGTVLGYDGIPAGWREGLADVEPIDFKYTSISLNRVYDLSFRHALAAIARAGGRIGASDVEIPREIPLPVRLEQNFEGHVPVAQLPLARRVADSTTFAFDGIGFTVAGEARSLDGRSYVLLADLVIDGERVETVELPTDFTTRRYVPFFRYELPRGHHAVTIRLRNPDAHAALALERVIVYDSPGSARAAARR
jgi:hypothetical protein